MLDICADLVFDCGISEIIRKITYGSYVSFLPLLIGGARPFGQKLQLVIDSLESSETALAWTVRGRFRARTRTNFSVG